VSGFGDRWIGHELRLRAVKPKPASATPTAIQRVTCPAFSNG
jgi:hypothetical protein